MAEILGLDSIQLVILIAVIGVGLRTFWGMDNKPLKSLDYRKLSQTAVIAILVSVVAVSGNVELISPEATELQQLVFISSQIAAIIGIDVAVKAGRKAIDNKRNSDENVEQDLLNTQIEDFDDMLEDLPQSAPPVKDEGRS